MHIDHLQKGCGVGIGGSVSLQRSPIPWGARVGGDWWGWWQLLTRKISKFSTLFIAQISWFTLENLVILKKRSRFQKSFSKELKRDYLPQAKFFSFSAFWSSNFWDFFFFGGRGRSPHPRNQGEPCFLGP